MVFTGSPPSYMVEPTAGCNLLNAAENLSLTASISLRTSGVNSSAFRRSVPGLALSAIRRIHPEEYGSSRRRYGWSRSSELDSVPTPEMADRRAIVPSRTTSHAHGELNSSRDGVCGKTTLTTGRRKYAPDMINADRCSRC